MKTILVVLALLVAQYAHGAVTPSGWRVLTNSRSLSDEKLHITAAVMPGDPLITGWYLNHFNLASTCLVTISYICTIIIMLP